VLKREGDRLSEFAILYFRFFEESGSKGFKRTKAATLTSLLFNCNSKTLAIIPYFSNRLSVKRTLIGPSELPTEFTINQAIGRIPHPILGYLYGATPTGKFAQSDCRVLEKSSTKTLLEISILTGRPHQIRIHLAAIGYPLLGDPLYDVGGIAKTTSIDSKISVPSDCGYWLHAHQLGFIHPSTRENLSFICPPPPELMS